MLDEEITPDFLRNLSQKSDRVQDEVQRFLKHAKEAAERGENYTVIAAPVDIENTVATVLETKGFRRYTTPVYCGGVRQQGIFMTWD